MNQRLKAAVQSVAAPPFLEARIRSQIAATTPVRSGALRLVFLAAALLVCVSTGVAYHFGRFRVTPDSRESYIAQVSYRVGAMMRAGLGDHINCAVFRKYPAAAPPVEQLARELGPGFSGLLPLVEAHVPAGYRLMLGHHCEYHGRKFVHLAWRNDEHLLSLVITRKQPGESLGPSALAQDGVQRFAMSAFESRDFLVYLVSDLPLEQNAGTMLALAPGVKAYLETTAVPTS